MTTTTTTATKVIPLDIIAPLWNDHSKIKPYLSHRSLRNVRSSLPLPFLTCPLRQLRSRMVENKERVIAGFQGLVHSALSLHTERPNASFLISSRCT